MQSATVEENEIVHANMQNLNRNSFENELLFSEE